MADIISASVKDRKPIPPVEQLVESKIETPPIEQPVKESGNWKKLYTEIREAQLKEDHDEIRHGLVHAVTRYDRKQEERSQKNPKHYYNHYALGHYLGAVDRAHEDIKKGHSVATAINNHFNGALARHLHKHFKTGDTDVDSKRKKSFNEIFRHK